MEQRNIYRGNPSRAWVQLRLIANTGETRDLEFLADTGNPCAIIIDETMMKRMRWRASTKSDSNFGLLTGGWLHIAIPEIKFDGKMQGFANDTVVNVVKRSEPSFAGLVGLPLLRMLTYGGDAGTFWIGRED